MLQIKHFKILLFPIVQNNILHFSSLLQLVTIILSVFAIAFNSENISILAEMALAAQIKLRGSLIGKAKVAELTQRYEDMSLMMKKVVEIGQELNNEERNLLSTAYQRVAGFKRHSWRVISNLERKAKVENDSRIFLVRTSREKIEAELEKVCMEIIELVDNYLLKGNNNFETNIFYNKMKGDYYRYMCEAIGIPDKRKKLVALANTAYSTALSISNKIDPLNPIKLSLILNYAVFLYEVKHSQKKAILIAQTGFDNAMIQIETLSDDSYKDATLILQMLKDNIKVWSNTIMPALEYEESDSDA